MVKVWYDKDVSLDPLRKETIAVVGYGIQGSAQASNLRDSGLKVILGLRKGGKSWAKAVSDGYEVYEVSEATDKASIIHVLIPDMEHANVYTSQIQPHLTHGKALSFSHGASIHWKWVEPPEWVDVIMVAPKGPGQRVRELYTQGFGVPSLVAVYQNHTGRAWDRVLAMAKGIGASKAMVIATTFEEEVESDWFGEQVDLCGGVHKLITTAFEVLVEAGYTPEVAYFETLHELKLITDLIQRYGIAGMYRRVSETARHGGLTRGGRVIGDEVRKRMREALADIQAGRYAEEWVKAWEAEGQNAFDKHLKELDAHPIEKVGRKLREAMWPGETVV